MIRPDTLYQFSEILRQVRVLVPGSHPVIGGGALRDLYHGRPIKDVDVFLRAEDHPAPLSHPGISLMIPPSISGYALRSDMHGVWNVREPLCGFDVQLIVADFGDMFDLAETFDLGLSRITYEGGQYVHMTEDFLRDSLNQVFRILRSDDDGQTARSERRIERLLLKYPEFTNVGFDPYRKAA